MYLVCNSSGNAKVLLSIAEHKLVFSGNSIVFYGEGTVAATSNDADALSARFEDIVDALNSGDVTVYDVRKDVGYWKPKTRAHSTAKKPAAKSGGDASS